MEDYRKSPDLILKKIKAEQSMDKRGHLKIFFGYAAGVGKTYAMLKAARAAKKHGIDVVVGYIEPHSRPQTAALLEGLECLPTRLVKHNNITTNEFDLDVAVKRHPALILVDELAHTNADDSRHIKRYQDIDELLTAGIDVYTTVNVQHIESLNDMVSSITGVIVRERIPDNVFDKADQVELVDIEPGELIERLNRGKIYKEEQAQKALSNFFSVENLVALREIALRRCADRINKLTEKSRPDKNLGYYTEEHILVCLSSSPSNAKIIRTASRMASAFKGAFTALFVETPDFIVMTEENKNRLRENIRLAQQLGAKIETVYGDDIALQIAEFARFSGVSKIVLGRNNARRRYFFGKSPLTEKLTMLAPNLDIHIIPDKELVRYKAKKYHQNPLSFNLPDTLKSVLLLVTATIIGSVFFRLGFSEANIITIYILSVLVTSIVTSGRMYSIISSVLSVLVFNFFFTDPRFTLNAYDSGYPVTFLIMFISAFITSSLAVKIKQHASQSAQTAYRTNILLETNQLLQKCREKSEIIAVAGNQLLRLLKKDIVFYAKDELGLSQPVIFSQDKIESTKAYINSNEMAVATWVLKNNKHAGATTNTLGNSKCLYLAVRVNSTVYGVVGIAISGEPLVAFENSIVLSVLGECALALENEQIAKEKANADLFAKNEQLRANLLRAISHDLRTPLTSISGNAGILMSEESKLDNKKKQQLYTDIFDDSLWLINLVENLLSVTRIEDGTMNLKFSAQLVEEVIDEALQHINRNSIDHKITVVRSDDLILAKMDARLIVQVIINIVDNAIKYTPSGSEIVIETKKQNGEVLVTISDTGEGIPQESKEKIFDMFYTGNTKSADSRRGLGLGLALCKAIIIAHGGEIKVSDNHPKGTVFSFILPSEEVCLHE
ncbi:MAG: sensor histidine kinase KdpD [Oscillospiraceae bacterium]